MKNILQFFFVVFSIFTGTNPLLAQWIQTAGIYTSSIYSFAVSGPNFFAGRYGGGVFLSADSGSSWIAVNNGLTNSDVLTLAVSGTNLFAGTYGGGVWRRPLSEMITSVEKVSAGLPGHFSLDQNSPNPFNPSTSISFTLPTKSFVSLKVLDVSGREVSALVSEELSAGTYAKAWDAPGLPSGVYFYRLQAADPLTGSGQYLTGTKKLLLVR